MKNIVFTIFFFVICFPTIPGYGQKAPAEGLFKIKVNGKYGFMNGKGKVVIQPQFEGVNDFSEGLANIYVRGRFGTGYIDETGKVAITPAFDIGSDFSEGLAWVGFDPEKKPYKLGPLTLYTTQCGHCFNYNIGFINKSGEMITEAVFARAEDFSEGLALVQTKAGKYGFIDKTGRFAISPQFEWAESFSEGLAVVFVKGKYGFIDKTGKMVIKPQFTDARGFSEGLACVKIGGAVRKRGIGDQTISTTAADLNFAYIDKTGKTSFKLKALDAQSFSEGFARFEGFVQGNNGFIDRTGKIVIDPEFNAVGDFNEGLAMVLLPGDAYRFGFIDKGGNVLIKTSYHLVSDFNNGLAEVQELAPNDNIVNIKYGYIDKTGKVLWQPTK